MKVDSDRSFGGNIGSNSSEFVPVSSKDFDSLLGKPFWGYPIFDHHSHLAAIKPRIFSWQLWSLCLARLDFLECLWARIPETQLLSGTLFPFFLVAAPLKRSSQKRVPFFFSSRATEQLRKRAIGDTVLEERNTALLCFKE